MITLRKSADRGHADHGWLKSLHSFSFADYHDPRHMGFGNLRVINEDRIAPGTGFGTHAHRDMEIVSYVLSGELAHKDSLGTGGGTGTGASTGDGNGASTGTGASTGNGDVGAAAAGIIRPGDVQRMSAGRGVRHSEYNHAADRTTHFLQIWIEPNVRGIEASYEQKHFDEAAKRGRLCLIASPDGRDGSVTLHADASIFSGLFDDGEALRRTIDSARKHYLHLVRGSALVNGQSLTAGDALRLENESLLTIEQGHGAELLVFELR